MKKILELVFLRLAFTLLLPALALNLAAQEQALPKLNIGDPAPAMKVAKWLKGEPVKGFEKGKVYIVEFWATWCKPCIAGMPHLSELARKYKGKVTVSGISVMERGDNLMPRLQRFTDSMGKNMDYNVAADEGSYMRENWLTASGEYGIPCAYVVDQQGRIAWIGLPKKLDLVLPRIVSGNWDISEAAHRRKEQQRLTPLDNAVVTRLNPFMGNPGKPDSALLEIGKILQETPQLKYYPRVGHFTFWSLIKTDPAEAVKFGKAWIAASEEPQWKTITDAVSSMASRGTQLPVEAYLLGAESFQAQLDNYPWSMNFPATYKQMADLYQKAGDAAKAAEMLKKAEAATAGKNTSMN